MRRSNVFLFLASFSGVVGSAAAGWLALAVLANPTPTTISSPTVSRQAADQTMLPRQPVSEGPASPRAGPVPFAELPEVSPRGEEPTNRRRFRVSFPFGDVEFEIQSRH